MKSTRAEPRVLTTMRLRQSLRKELEFSRDEFQPVADAIVEALSPHRAGFEGVVLYITRR